MEVFSKGVVVTVTLFPLCSGQCSEDGDYHRNKAAKLLLMCGVFPGPTLRMSSTTSVWTRP